MIKELRKVKDQLKAMRIRQLIYRGRLTKHVSESGYVAYDTEELTAYMKNPVRQGRPIKKESENE